MSYRHLSDLDPAGFAIWLASLQDEVNARCGANIWHLRKLPDFDLWADGVPAETAAAVVIEDNQRADGSMRLFREREY